MASFVIFCAGGFEELIEPLKQEDFLLAADGGLVHLQNLGLTPHGILGDFDSLGYVPEDARVFPVEKDDTDAMLAVKKGLPAGSPLQFLLLHVDLGQTLAEGAGDLVVDGAGGMGDIVGGDAVDAVGTHDDDLVTHLDLRHIGDIDHALVHADVAGNGADHAVDDDLGLGGIGTGITVGIAQGDGGDLGGLLAHIAAAVTNREAGANFLHVDDAGLDGHDGLDVQLLPAFPDQGLREGLPCLDLAAHELPQQAPCLICRTLAGQESLALPNEGRNHICHRL